MKKLSTVEKMLIDTTDTDTYNLYRCPEDGIFAIRKDIEKQICPYCKKECDKYVPE